jgi:Spy/CpxP family protein refolding chaperone
MRMKMRAKAVKSALGATALFLCAALAGAQPADGMAPSGPKGGRGGFMGERLGRVLNLSADQEAAFQKLLDEQRPQMQALHQQMRDNHQKLQDLLKGDNPDPSTVGQLVIQEHGLMKQSATLRDQASQSLRGLLTPDQQTKFDALQSLRQDGGFGPGGPRGFGHRGGWGGPGGPPPAPPQQ